MGNQYEDLQHHHHHHHHRFSHLHCHHAQCSWCPFALLSVCSARSSGHRDPSVLSTHFTGYKEVIHDDDDIADENHFDGVDEAGDSCAVQYENSSNTVQGGANIGSLDMSVR